MRRRYSQTLLIDARTCVMHYRTAEAIGNQRLMRRRGVPVSDQLMRWRSHIESARDQWQAKHALWSGLLNNLRNHKRSHPSALGLTPQDTQKIANKNKPQCRSGVYVLYGAAKMVISSNRCSTPSQTKPKHGEYLDRPNPKFSAEPQDTSE